jgi:hypothetical protein
MTSAQVPAHLKEAITMPMEDLREIITGNLSSSLRLTRSNIFMLKKILAARTSNQFEYMEFEVTETESEMESEIDDDDIVIEMNDFIPSPVYHHEFYVTTPESSNNSSRQSVSEEEYMENLAAFCTNILKNDFESL